MKKKPLLVLSVITITALHAQHVVLGLDKMNVAYIGVPNPMSIASDIYSCDQLVVKEDGILLEGKDCQYNLHATKVGVTEIEIFGLRGHELVKIGVEAIRVKRLPDFAVAVAGSNSDGTISKSKLSKCYGPVVNTAGFPYQTAVTITAFTITVYRSGMAEILFQKNTQSEQFDPETRKIFQQLKDSDIVELSNIRARGPEGSKKLQNLRLTLNN